MDEAARLSRQAARVRFERPLDAKRDWAEAVRLCREAGARDELVETLKGLGQIERDMGNGEAALGHYGEAVAICRGLDNPRRLAHTLRHVADILLDLGRIVQAEPCFVEALALYRADADRPLGELANAVRGMAALREATGEVLLARLLWREARDVYSAIGVEAGVSECSRRLARLSQDDIPT